jgi:hypothetical protein
MVTTKLRKIGEILSVGFRVLMVMTQPRKIGETLALLMYFDRVLFADIARSVITRGEIPAQFYPAIFGKPFQ